LVENPRATEAVRIDAKAGIEMLVTTRATLSVGLGLVLGAAAVTHGQEAKVIHHRGPAIRGVTFSPDGKVVAACNRDGVMLWNTETWEQQETLKRSEPVSMSVRSSGHANPLPAGIRPLV
jgi:hypothetical protein